LPPPPPSPPTSPGSTSIPTKDLDISNERIGSGSHGEVFKGQYFGTSVAVKKLFSHNMTEKMLSKFEQECKIMQVFLTVFDIAY
jgi:hypothetical protein